MSSAPSSSFIDSGTALGESLQSLLMAEDIIPGSEPSYALCKIIYLYHPLGAKMAESPISMAQSQDRMLNVHSPCGLKLVKQFENEWKKLECDRIIFNTMRLSRIYGIASVALLVGNEFPTNIPVNYSELWKMQIAFNVFDPLNTAGSLVMNLRPNDMNFLKANDGLYVQGANYHPTRVCIVMNEDPIFIGYTTSTFGYTGRSVYQRALFPLKSFINSIVTDDMVTKKAGVLIAKLKAPGSIIDNVMQSIAGFKRAILQEAQNNNVVSISVEEEVESLNLQNVSPAFGDARRNILENIAVSADMPAKLLNSETFAEGFGEGTEDAKNVARYIDRIRIQMEPIYKFFDKVTMYRAWNPEFYKALKNEYPKEYKGISYEQAFYSWCESFESKWPNLLTEPDSDKIKIEDVRLKAVLALLEVLLPSVDADSRVKAILWAVENFNGNKMLFSHPLALSEVELKKFEQEQEDRMNENAQPQDQKPLKPPHPKRPFADSDVPRIARLAYDRAVDNLDTLSTEVRNTELAEAKKEKLRAGLF